MFKNLKKIKIVNDIVCKADKRVKAELTILLILCIVILLTVSWQEIAHNSVTSKLEGESVVYLDGTLEKATAAFLIARALNATISVMQSFTVTPFIGQLSLGEVLDPINDLIENFSWVMLAVIVSVGLQQLLMEVGVAVDLSWLLLPALIFILVSLFTSAGQSKYRLRMLAYKLLLFTLLVRFAIPVTGMVGSHISNVFLAEKRDTAMQSIQKSKEKIGDISISEAATSPKKILEQIQKDSQEIVAQMIKLITLFSFETILFPILVLWGLIKIFGVIFYWPLTRSAS